MNMHRNFVIVLGSLALLLILSSVMLPTTSASATPPEPESANYPNNVDSWAELGPFDLSNASAANGQYTPSQDNGDWGGTTSQNLPISFTVASNMVTFLHFRVDIVTTFFTCTAPVYNYNTHNITGNTFSVTGQEVYIGGSTLTYTVTGTFNSNTSASGNLQATMSGGVCNGGSASPTWTATWQSGEPPDPPSNLTALAWSETEILLDWQDNSPNETGFKIEQALAATGPWTQVATTPGAWYMVSGLNCSTTYYYRVRAYNAYGDSDPSNTDNATTLDCPNTPPTLTGLPDQTLPVNTSRDNAIDLWAYAIDLESPVSALTFTIDNTPDASAGVSLDSNRYIDINPASGWIGQTSVRIRVTDPGGLSSTDTFSVTVSGQKYIYLPAVMKNYSPPTPSN